jgi:hypothetical protein
MRRTFKLSFRRKPGARSSVKVYVTVRLWDEPRPKQLHLGYLRTCSRLSHHAKLRLAKRLRDQWRRHCGSGDVAVDWVATEAKWRERDQPKQAPVNRDAAREQLRQWQSGANEVLLPPFGGPKTQNSEIAGGEFHQMFMESHLGILKMLRKSGRSIDPAVVATWWEEREAPRLLCCFHRFAGGRPARRFGRAGFLRYLAGNIARGFAVAQFLRENPSPMRSPLTESESGAESEASRL